METGGLSSQSAGAGVGRVFSWSRAEPASRVHRMAAYGVYRRVCTGGFSAVGNVEGLAGVSPDRRICRCVAQGSGGRELRVFWQDFVWHAAAEAALAAR